MANPHHPLPGLLLKHTAIGFGLSAVFVTALLWADVAQLGTLIGASPQGWLAAAMLYFFNGLTFASVQCGIAIMQIGSDGGGRRRLTSRHGHVGKPGATR